MSKNLSKENKTKLLEDLARVKAHLSAGEKNEETARLIACIDEVEADLKSRRYGLVFEEHREEVEELLERCKPILQEEPSMYVGGEGVCHSLIEGDNLAALTALKAEYEGKIDFID